MEFLIAMTAGIVGKVFEYTVEPLGRQVGYLIRYKRNLQNLESQVDNLSATRDRMHRIIDEEKRRGKKVEIDAQNWLNKVEEVIGESNKFLCQKNSKCIHGLCPNPVVTYHRSRKSTRLVQVITLLHEKREITNVAYNDPPQEIWSIPNPEYEVLESRLSIVKKIMEELRNPTTNRIGVYGIGGVGKTTLVKDVYRLATKETKLFDDVVMILDVRQNPDVERIQHEIAEKLGMDVVEKESRAARARRLFNRIKDDKILVIFDDVFEKFDLANVGLPAVGTCKILFTSRSREVLSCEMHTQREFQLHILGEEESLSLFGTMAGEVIKDPSIQSVATDVATHCGGLPVLIVTVASALRNRSTLHAWKDVLRRLKRVDKDGLKAKAYSALEWSYDQLDGEELKQLFLLCGITLGLNFISLEDLLKYSIGWDFLKNVITVEEARNALHSLLEKLKDSCLLLEGKDKNSVRIHDLVREVAVSILYRDQHVLSLHYGDELKEWPSTEFLKKCTAIALPYCLIPMLPEVLNGQALKMFYLASNNKMLEIPGNFFEEMKGLKMLDLTNMHIPSLPPSLQFLANLRTLCLDKCKLGDISPVGNLINLQVVSFLNSHIENLPREIGQLIFLRLLDLTGCSQLKVIAPNVISNLKRLEDLRMGNSFYQWEEEGLTGHRSNASLLELKHLSQLTALDIHIWDPKVLPADLFSSNLERYHIFIGDVWKWDSVDDAFNTVKLKLTASNQLDQSLKMLLKRSEHLYLDVMEGGDDILYLLHGDGLQRLEHLHVQNNAEITCLINSTDWSYTSHVAFSVLELLCLENVVRLECVCSGQLTADSFRKLKYLTLRNLPKLMSFSSNGRKHVVQTRESREIVLHNENQIRCPMQLLMNGEVSLPNLTKLIVDQCDGLRFLFSPSMVKSLLQLKHLEISRCETMEEIICTQEHGAENSDTRFPKLDHLQLEHLPNLTRFCSGSYNEFPSLQCLVLDDCNRLEAFIYEEKESKTTGQVFLFDEKVGFPRLEKLSLRNLTMFKTIWDNHLALDSFRRLKFIHAFGCKSLVNIFPPSMTGKLQALDTLGIWFCNSLQVIFDLEGSNIKATQGTSSATPLQVFDCQKLDSVEVKFCENLRSVFPSTVARCLQQLQTLIVFKCGVEEVIAKDDEELQTPTKFVFPKVTHVMLQELPQLKCFYPGLHVSTWPSLKEVLVSDCDKLKNLAAECLSIQEKSGFGFPCTNAKQSLFSIKRGSYSNLEDLTLGNMEISDGPLPAKFFSKLKSLQFSCARSNSAVCLQMLHNLENLTLNYAPFKIIFVHEGSSSDEILAVRTSPLQHLRFLRLFQMPELMYLVQEKYQPAGSILPNLETLEVQECEKLKSLRSSAISFKNLTTLKVIGCEQLKYLTTYSMCKDLVRLTKVEVKNCQKMVVIVATDGDDGEEGIALSRLQYLTLSCLPSLQGFCSGDCIVKFPSLNILDISDCLELVISPDGVLLNDTEASNLHTKEDDHGDKEEDDR